MTTHAIMPIGIVSEWDDQHGSFIIASPSQYGMVEPDTPIVIWAESQELYAKYRGIVTESSERSASFVITHQEIDPDWPDDVNPRGHNSPVYVGLPDSFIPNPARPRATQQELAHLTELATRIQRDTGVDPAGASLVAILPEDDPDSPRLE